MKKVLGIDGCDASTVFVIELTEQECATIERLIAITHNISASACMPTVGWRDDDTMMCSACYRDFPLEEFGLEGAMCKECQK